MKTTIDISDESLREAIKHTRAKTKREAVVTAVDEFNRRRRLDDMAERLHGSCPDFMSQEELKRMRQDHKWDPDRHLPKGRLLAGEHTRPRVSQSAPSPIASPYPISNV